MCVYVKETKGKNEEINDKSIAKLNKYNDLKKKILKKVEQVNIPCKGSKGYNNLTNKVMLF